MIVLHKKNIYDGIILGYSNWAYLLFFLSFMFDEPSSYLDVKQRLKAAITIRSLINPDR